MAILAQNPFDQQEDENTDLTSINTGAAGNISSVPNQTMGQVAQEPERQGSGRFTNIQKFMQANPGAGQRIADSIGQNIEQTEGVKVKKAETDSKATGQAIDETRNKVETIGAGFKDTFTDENFSATKFTQPKPTKTEGQPAQVEGDMTAAGVQPAPVATEGQPDGIEYNYDLGGYIDYRSGEFIDADGIRTKLTDAELSRAIADKATQSLVQSLSSAESIGPGSIGRFGLLRRTFGSNTPYYGRGMQRLDQAFLESDKSGALQGLQSQAAQLADQTALVSDALYGEGGTKQRFTELLDRKDEIDKELQDTVESLLDSKNKSFEDSAKKRMSGLGEETAQQRSDMQLAFDFALGKKIANTPENIESIRRGATLLGLSSDQAALFEPGNNYLNIDSLLQPTILGSNSADFRTLEEAKELNALTAIRDLTPNIEEQYSEGQFSGVDPVSLLKITPTARKELNEQIKANVMFNIDNATYPSGEPVEPYRKERMKALFNDPESYYRNLLNREIDFEMRKASRHNRYKPNFERAIEMATNYYGLDLSWLNTYGGGNTGFDPTKVISDALKNAPYTDIDKNRIISEVSKTTGGYTFGKRFSKIFEEDFVPDESVGRLKTPAIIT